MIEETNLHGDLDDAERRFLNRKCCRDLADDDCRSVFHLAVQIARVATLFRRTRCGTLPPRKTAARYELLHCQASGLESAFPQADSVLILQSCKWVEGCWDR